ncbi:hypothetical protein F5Y03DRAFT_376879 [Xylaria venustula]|nr:hypothetical protein F5Y03DRAFT_376879 [Xylaria venustula]
MAPISILSTRSFSETKKAFEAAVPPLNLTFQQHLAKGEYDAARAALEALPPLNNFLNPPRNFTGLLLAVGQSGQALQYEVGNPLTASSIVHYNLDIGLQTPRRVLLRVDGDKVEFKYELLAGIVAPYKIPEVDEIAKKLDAKIIHALRQAGGQDLSG